MNKFLLFTFLFASISSFSQTLDPVSLEQLVNTDVASNQYCPVIAADDDGNYIIFWTMNSYSGAIKARRYNSNHQAISDEITINSDNSKLMVAQYWEDGKFVLSYIENTGNNLKFTIINPDNSLETEVTVLNNIENFDMDINGDSLVFAYNGTANNSQIYLRGYNLGTSDWINSQVLVTESAGVNYSEPNVVIHPDGRMTIIYHQYILVSGCCDYYRNIMRKTFSSSFLAEIPEQTLWYVDSELNVGSDLDAEGNAESEVMIVTTHGTTSSNRYMRLWILSASGSTIVNNSQLLSGGGNDWYDNIECHLYDNGDFLVTKSIRTGGYTNPNGNEAYVISGSNYNESNSGLLQLNATNAGNQEYVALAVFPNGGFVTAWAGNGFQGDSQGIYSRAYNAVAYPGFAAANTSYQVSEMGSTNSIPVTLNTQPSADVTISISSSNPSEISFSPATLTFTSANWNTPQYITVQGLDDSADDGNTVTTLTLSASSADANYNSLSAFTVNVTNLDDDATISAVSAQAICQTDGLSTVSFSVSNNGGNITDVYATSGNQAIVDDSDIMVINEGSGNYSLSINNLSNNILGTVTVSIVAVDDNFNYTSTFEVDVQGVELILASQDQTICEGEMITLSASGATSISWDNGVTNNEAFAPSETYTYTVTASNGGICSAEDMVTITVNSIAATPEIIASSTEICAGESVTLSVSGNDSYTWDNGIENGVAFTPNETMTYSVEANNGTNCTSSSSIEVVVNELPNAPQIFASVEEICSGEEVTLFATGSTTITWDNDVVNNVAFMPMETTTYTATGNNGGICSASTSIEIVVNQTPEVPVITSFFGGMVSSSNTGNQWYFNGELMEGETGQTLLSTAPGDYYVVVSNGDCSATSEVFSIITNVEELNLNSKIYPNPAQTEVIVSGIAPGTIMTIYDMNGK
ncbi:MAG: hypothetical protein R2809_00270 [Flavobacteriales bacterium]